MTLRNTTHICINLHPILPTTRLILGIDTIALQGTPRARIIPSTKARPASTLVMVLQPRVGISLSGAVVDAVHSRHTVGLRVVALLVVRAGVVGAA